MQKTLVWTVSLLVALVIGGIGYFAVLKGGLLDPQYAEEQAAPQTPQSQQDQAETKDESRIAPSLDLVRVEPDGSTLVAGRAAPNATVELTQADRLVGSAQANAVGEWVIVTEEPLAKGTSELALTSTLPDGTKVEGDENIVVELAQDGTSQPLVVVMDKDAPARVVSQPQPPKTEVAETVLTPPSTPAAPETMAPKPEQATAEQAPPATAEPSQMAANETPAEKPVEPQAQPQQTAEAPTPAPAAEAPAASEAPVAKEETTASVLVQSVETDTQGRLMASGEAGAGADVRLYLNNELVGNATSDANGKWQIVGERKLDAGDYTVRVDQVDGAGAVQARTMVPFNQTVEIAANSPLPDNIQLEKLEIKRGDNLWRISRRLYGEGRRYTVIYDANRNEITNPDLIFPGQVFVIPPTANQ